MFDSEDIARLAQVTHWPRLKVVPLKLWRSQNLPGEEATGHRRVSYLMHGLSWGGAAATLTARTLYGRDLGALVSNAAQESQRKPTSNTLKLCEQLAEAVLVEQERREDLELLPLMEEDRSVLRRERAKELKATMAALEEALNNGDAAGLKLGVAQAEQIVAELAEVPREDVDMMLAKYGRIPGSPLPPLENAPSLPAYDSIASSPSPKSTVSWAPTGAYSAAPPPPEKHPLQTAPFSASSSYRKLRPPRRPADLEAIHDETRLVQQEMHKLIQEIKFPSTGRIGTRLSHRTGSAAAIARGKSPPKGSPPRMKRRKRHKKPEPEDPVLDSALRELPPAQAMRTALLLKFGSLRSVWRMLDSNGSGSLSYSEFAEGIERSKVPWKEITGLPQLKDVFKLFDVDGDHEVSLVEFLGFPDADDHHTKGPVPTATMWKRYINNVKLSPMTLCRQPKWNTQVPLEYRLQLEHHPADLAVIAENARKDDDEVKQMKRVMNAQIEESARRVEVKIRDIGQSTEAMKVCKNTISEVYNSERGTKNRGERTAEQKLEKAKGAFGGFASLGGPRLRPVELPRGAEQGIAHFKKPPDDELMQYFSEKYVTDAERELRTVARRHGIPIVDAGKIYEQFSKYDEDGSGAIEREEFRNVVSDMLCVGKAKGCELADTVVDQFFVTADKRRCGEVSFEDFLCWSYFNGIFRLPE